MSLMSAFWTLILDNPSLIAPEEPAASGKKPSKANKEMDAGEFHVGEGSVPSLPNQSGEEMIQELLQTMHRHVGKYWLNCYKGIDGFADAMSLDAAEEAEPKYLSAAFKSVCKSTLDLAFEKAAEQYGGHWGKAISFAKSVGEAWVEECERAGKAAGEANAATFISTIKNSIDKPQREMEAAIDSAEGSIIQEYQRLAADDVRLGITPEVGLIVGSAAVLIDGLKAGIDAFNSSIPSAASFQQQFTTAYADSPGSTPAGRLQGKLYFEISLYKYNDDWSIVADGTSTEWTLVTANNPEKTASSLLASQNGALDVCKIKLPKTVNIKVEEEIEWAFNKYYTGAISFDSSPSSYENGGVVTDLAMIAEAWNLSMTRNKVMGTKKLKGTNE